MLLFLDVDGTLIPFGGSQPHRQYSPRVMAADPGAHPFLARVDPDLGQLIAGLGCEIVWATTWSESDANSILAPWLGWAPLPSVPWPEGADLPGPLHWKLRPLLAQAGREPFIWLDDEITEADRRWVDERHTGRALLHRVDHRTGLTRRDIETVANWIQGE